MFSQVVFILSLLFLRLFFYDLPMTKSYFQVNSVAISLSRVTPCRIKQANHLNHTDHELSRCCYLELL